MDAYTISVGIFISFLAAGILIFLAKNKEFAYLEANEQIEKRTASFQKILDEHQKNELVTISFRKRKFSEKYQKDTELFYYFD